MLLAVLACASCEKSNPAAPSPSSPAGTRVIALSGNLAFGSVEAGKTSESTLTIGNSGTGTLSVTGITVPDGYALNWSSGIDSAGRFAASDRPVRANGGPGL